MSPRLISRSPDLSRLRAEGYDIVLAHGHLLVRDVPYLDGSGRPVRGTLIKALTLTGDVADRPNDHTVFLAGPLPHDVERRPLTAVADSGTFNLIFELPAQHRLSRKPSDGYPDFYTLVTTYCGLLSKHVQAIDRGAATAQTHPTVLADEEEGGPFLYVDTASARAGITAVNAKLEQDCVAIVGLGGSGAYILDLVAKSPVARLDLFDGDASQRWSR